MGVSDYSTTAGSNTSISGIDTSEGMAASAVNNAFRQGMADQAALPINELSFTTATKTGTYTILAADKGKLFRFTSTATANLTAAATVGGNFFCMIKADGAAVTIDPDSTETVDGATTLAVADGESLILLCNGTSWYTVGYASAASLGLVIGVDVMAYDATMLVDADIGGSVQAYDANLPTWPSTVDATEVGYLNGVTSAIQTQMDTKAPIADPTFTGEIGIGSVNVSETELGILEGATPSTTEFNYVNGVTSAIQTQLDAKEASDADILKADTADVLTKGFAATPYNAGTKSSGTYTPDEANSNLQYAVNGGAHTFAPPSNNCTLIVQYTNNGSAGTVTTSGFTLVDGDDLTTTNGDDFLFYVVKINGFSHLTVKALQ